MLNVWMFNENGRAMQHAVLNGCLDNNYMFKRKKNQGLSVLEHRHKWTGVI